MRGASYRQKVLHISYTTRTSIIFWQIGNFPYLVAHIKLTFFTRRRWTPSETLITNSAVFCETFLEDIDLSPFCGATDTTVLDFWWRLLWVSKPECVFMSFNLFIFLGATHFCKIRHLSYWNSILMQTSHCKEPTCETPSRLSVNLLSLPSSTFISNRPKFSKVRKIFILFILNGLKFKCASKKLLRSVKCQYRQGIWHYLCEMSDWLPPLHIHFGANGSPLSSLSRSTCNLRQRTNLLFTKITDLVSNCCKKYQMLSGNWKKYPFNCFYPKTNTALLEWTKIEVTVPFDERSAIQLPAKHLRSLRSIYWYI